LGGRERVRRAGRLLGEMSDAQRLMRLVEVTDGELRASLVAGPGDEAAAERNALAADVLAGVSGRSLLEQALYLDTRMFLPDRLLVCADKMSMSASLEVRVPFLDVELMRFVERIPVGERVRLRQGKRIHRRAMGRLVPEEVSRRPRHGFASPYESWLRESLGEEVGRRFARGSALGELVDPGTVARLVAEHREGRADQKAILYSLLELSEWHRAFIAGAPDGAPPPAGAAPAQSPAPGPPVRRP